MAFGPNLWAEIPISAAGGVLSALTLTYIRHVRQETPKAIESLRVDLTRRIDDISVRLSEISNRAEFLAERVARIEGTLRIGNGMPRRTPASRKPPPGH